MEMEGKEGKRLPLKLEVATTNFSFVVTVNMTAFV
jgi:hypothetical protein